MEVVFTLEPRHDSLKQALEIKKHQQWQMYMVYTDSLFKLYSCENANTKQQGTFQQ